MKNERLEAIRKRTENNPPRVREVLSPDYYLGWFIGEFIVGHFLPGLSCDNNTLVQVKISDEEQIEYDRLSEDYQKNWDDYISYRKMLKKKYIPEILKCYVPNFVTENMEDVKRGIRESLWDSDVCSYQIFKNEDIEIGEDPGSWCQRKITLHRSIVD
jgi:hypothetical protein